MGYHTLSIHHPIILTRDSSSTQESYPNSGRSLKQRTAGLSLRDKDNVTFTKGILSLH